MLRQSVIVAAFAALMFTSPIVAQQPAPAAQQPPAKELPPPAAQAAPKPPPEGQPVNVRIEITISEATGPGDPARKLVTMILADRQNGSIRTSGWVRMTQERRDVMINVDARPFLLRDNAIRLELGLQYQPAGSSQTATSTDVAQTGLNERLNTILESGKPLVVSQASDPASDRRISVEVKATILR
ncbi:MAG: hypothetical protein LC753_19070 [Acidobacteria bacterium]|nr:hypothetical protein [Acidobacteriota bacterium]MCA1652266.1 hypothetical protein [Acidobacteriota bacterium]